MNKVRVFEWLGMAGVIFIYCLLLPTKGYSQSEQVQQVANNLKKHFPEIQTSDIKTSEIEGLYQVTRGPSIVYVTENGRYIFSGDIIDLNNQYNNITEVARQKARASAIESIQKVDAIRFAPKNPKYTVTVFTDIDCGYCRKFHKQIKEYNDKGIAVQYLAFPRTGPDTDSYKKAISVWCADNKNQALTQAKMGENVKTALCDQHHVKEQFQMGILMGVQGTPTIILENGYVIPGYLTPDRLVKVLKQDAGNPNRTAKGGRGNRSLGAN